MGDHPEQKMHVLEVCGCLLSLTSHRDLLHERTADFKAQETGQPIEEEQSQDVFSSTEPSGPSTSKTSKVSESCDILVGKCAPVLPEVQGSRLS